MTPGFRRGRRLLRCAALFPGFRRGRHAAYEIVRLVPRRLRALPLAILRSRYELHLKGKHYSVSFTIFKRNE